jgi:hypothetical protein
MLHLDLLSLTAAAITVANVPPLAYNQNTSNSVSPEAPSPIDAFKEGDKEDVMGGQRMDGSG